MERFVPNFSYAELSEIKELAHKELGRVLGIRGSDTINFYSNFVREVEEFKRTGKGISISPVVPDKKYILATIIYRVDKMDEVIKQELKRIRR